MDKIELSDEGRKQFFDNVGDLDGGGAVTFTYGDSTNCIVIFKDTPNNKVVAHELYHVAYRICTLRGIECEEAWAYLIGYLTEMFYDMYLPSDGEIIGGEEKKGEAEKDLVEISLNLTQAAKIVEKTNPKLADWLKFVNRKAIALVNKEK